MIRHLLTMIHLVQILLLTSTLANANDLQIDGEWSCEELIETVRITNDLLIFEYKEELIVAKLIHQNQYNESVTAPIHNLIFQNTSDGMRAYFFVNQTNMKLNITVMYESMALTKELVVCEKTNLSFVKRD